MNLTDTATANWRRVGKLKLVGIEGVIGFPAVITDIISSCCCTTRVHWEEYLPPLTTFSALGSAITRYHSTTATYSGVHRDTCTAVRRILWPILGTLFMVLKTESHELPYSLRRTIGGEEMDKKFHPKSADSST